MFPAKIKNDAGWQALHRKQAIRNYTEFLEKYTNQVAQLEEKIGKHIDAHPFLLQRTRARKWIAGTEFGCWKYPVELQTNSRDVKIRKLARQNAETIQTYHSLRGELLEANIRQEQVQSLFNNVNQ